MRLPSRRMAILLAVPTLSCGGRQPPVAAAPSPAPACRLMARSGAMRDTLFVGVPGAVDTANAARPETEAEQFVFGITQDSARRDCGGNPVPAPMAPYHLDLSAAHRIVALPLGGRGPVVVYRIAPLADPRDLLDQGADVVVTDDPATLDYAARRDEFAIAPLPWAWTYVLVGAAPVEPQGIAALDSLLAGGAVHGDVRPATPPFWWAALPPCDAPVNTMQPAAARVAYSASDPVAGDLAARLVALAADHRVSLMAGTVAAPLEPQAFDSALARRSEASYIAALPARSASTCAPFADVGLTPLVDARSHVIARRGVVTIDVDWNGTPYFVVNP